MELTVLVLKTVSTEKYGLSVEKKRLCAVVCATVRRKGLALQTHRTDGREKGPVVAGQQKGDTTWVGRTDQLLLQNERERTCLAEIALAGQTRGQSGREPNYSACHIPGGAEASCVESDGLFAASSISTWQRHARWDVRPGVDVTCWRRQKGDTTWVGRTDQLLLQNERERTCLAACRPRPRTWAQPV
eukprot:COSAG01_NODE_4162_length_5279_cov_33.245560_3_plen_188_part_00